MPTSASPSTSPTTATAANAPSTTRRCAVSLELRHVGNPGWDPLCFSSAQGLAYYLPTLVRFALAPPSPEHGWYGDQLLFHLSSDGAWNRLYCHCSPKQRGAVAALLAHLVETRAEEIDGHPEEDVLLQACALWSTPA
ncbi:hypothetical protein [Azotobacter salinestris]|uniref:hypothetical protein n=1 Tax=Azotobacter salinestris TaxID=69964 RepID=UPI001266E0D8|nr:hypothetical protein [Azotobacter salinestris]